jgi:hypothetical protein
MGLDMYAFYTEQENLLDNKDCNDVKPLNETVYEQDEVGTICTWRKHENLHGWMAQLAKQLY